MKSYQQFNEVAIMSKTFTATMDDLYAMQDFIGQTLAKVNFDPATQASVELVCEEALVNIISYSRQPPPGYIKIDCSETDVPGIKIKLTDGGMPYNPVEHVKYTDPDTPLEQRELGGFGIFFIVKLMDKVSYEYVDGANELTLIKYRKEAPKLPED